MTYVQPLLLIFIAVTLAGLLVFRSRKGRYVALGGVLGLFLISWPPVDLLLGRLLEGSYPHRPFQPPPDLQAIVVLGSSVDPPRPERPFPLPDLQTFQRCEYAAWIAKRWGPLPVLACEGRQRGPREENTMHELLRRAGVAEDLIWTEEQSRSTHENAVYGARILRAHGWQHIALVVDGLSMPRAIACFRKAGFDVTPAPAELRSWGPIREEVLPSWKAIRRNETTLHELLGLGWYRLRGWT
jgi:uncharacterized SAM-binding protein YcdF (DUF218 family)